ncbi:MAG: Tetratricopeptide domain protein [Phycisphaerales bacterium]|nr:Tetratricopeptide domain protein [Phycisphaerales bacterium]
MVIRMLLLAAVLSAAPASVVAGPVEDLVSAATQALDKGDKDNALALANKAVEAGPKDSQGYVARASVHHARREYDKAVLDYGKVIELQPSLAIAYQRRGEEFFRLGKFKQSVADFDKVIELQPAQSPYHWQRGISLYYAGEFDRGAKQFELHKTVNPDDVENAVWHYLCIARASGIEKAKKGLIPIQGDTRVPMMQVHAMFAGKATADDVMKAATAGEPGAAEKKQRLFYAHLYIGLFSEAAGQSAAAKEHILLAAEKYADDDYMGDVARVHAAILKQPTAK